MNVGHKGQDERLERLYRSINSQKKEHHFESKNFLLVTSADPLKVQALQKETL